MITIYTQLDVSVSVYNNYLGTQILRFLVVFKFQFARCLVELAAHLEWFGQLFLFFTEGAFILYEIQSLIKGTTY